MMKMEKKMKKKKKKRRRRRRRRIFGVDVNDLPETAVR
jgi:hypothetical protein